MTNIRHINRGDIKEGGCPMCKPRHQRKGSYTLPKDAMLVAEDIEEGLEEFDGHAHEEDWSFGV